MVYSLRSDQQALKHRYKSTLVLQTIIITNAGGATNSYNISALNLKILMQCLLGLQIHCYRESTYATQYSNVVVFAQILLLILLCLQVKLVEPAADLTQLEDLHLGRPLRSRRLALPRQF
jgi:hypothetical protein